MFVLRIEILIIPKMKIIFLFTLFLPSLLIAQYQPFNDNVPKRFHEIDNPYDADYYFYSYQSDTLNDTLLFNQYFKVGQEVVEILCPNWGGDFSPTGDTTWLGREIYYNTSSKQLSLYNSSNEELNYDFNIPLGDSAIFYQDATNEYFIKFITEVQETILGQTEWVRTYQIKHYDELGEL